MKMNTFDNLVTMPAFCWETGPGHSCGNHLTRGTPPKHRCRSCTPPLTSCGRHALDFFPGSLTDARSDWDLVDLEARSTCWGLCTAILERCCHEGALTHATVNPNPLLFTWTVSGLNVVTDRCVSTLGAHCSASPGQHRWGYRCLCR